MHISLKEKQSIISLQELNESTTGDAVYALAKAMDKLTIFGVTKPVNQKTYRYGLNSFETDHRWHKEVMRLKKQYQIVKPGNEQGRDKEVITLIPGRSQRRSYMHVGSGGGEHFVQALYTPSFTL